MGGARGGTIFLGGAGGGYTGLGGHPGNPIEGVLVSGRGEMGREGYGIGGLGGMELFWGGAWGGTQYFGGGAMGLPRKPQKGVPISRGVINWQGPYMPGGSYTPGGGGFSVIWGGLHYFGGDPSSGFPYFLGGGGH